MNTHTVGPFNHSYISIVPNNQDKYKDDSRFSTNSAGDRVATVGAGPTGWGTTGTLASGLNRSRDADETLLNVEVIGLDFPGVEKSTMQEDDMIDVMLDAESRFDDSRFDYGGFPGLFGGQNSNSFISGLLDFLGITPNKTPYTTPGWGTPVPSDSFETTKGDEENQSEEDEGIQ